MRQHNLPPNQAGYLSRMEICMAPPAENASLPPPGHDQLPATAAGGLCRRRTSHHCAPTVAEVAGSGIQLGGGSLALAMPSLASHQPPPGPRAEKSLTSLLLLLSSEPEMQRAGSGPPRQGLGFATEQTGYGTCIQLAPLVLAALPWGLLGCPCGSFRRYVQVPGQVFPLLRWGFNE